MQVVGTRQTLFQSTRLSRASTWDIWPEPDSYSISIHKALASLDILASISSGVSGYFNPQGSREPRRNMSLAEYTRKMISIHKALASLDVVADHWFITVYPFQSTRLSRASTAKMHNYSCIYATFTCFILYIFYKSFIKLKFPRVI